MHSTRANEQVKFTNPTPRLFQFSLVRTIKLQGGRQRNCPKSSLDKLYVSIMLRTPRLSCTIIKFSNRNLCDEAVLLPYSINPVKHLLIVLEDFDADVSIKKITSHLYHTSTLRP